MGSCGRNIRDKNPYTIGQKTGTIILIHHIRSYQKNHRQTVNPEPSPVPTLADLPYRRHCLGLNASRPSEVVDFPQHIPPLDPNGNRNGPVMLRYLSLYDTPVTETTPLPEEL